MMEYLLTELPDRPDTFVLLGGIRWKNLFGSDLEKQSLLEAKNNKASHYIPAGAQQPSVGTISLDKADFKPGKSAKAGNSLFKRGAIKADAPVEKTVSGGRRIYSMAAIFAQGHKTGAFIGRVALADDLFWVVAAHEGVIEKGTDVLCDRFEADALVAKFKSEKPTAIDISMLGDVAQFLNSYSELIVPKNKLDSIPKSVYVVAIMIMMVVIGNILYGQWQTRKILRERAARVERTVDAKAEWNKALSQWAQNVKIDGPEGFAQLYSILGDVPLKIGGWGLVSANCGANLVGWSCAAHYTAGPYGTNETFQANLPAGWTAGWEGLSGAVGNWQVNASRHAIDRFTVTRIPEFNLKYISELQGVLTAYRTVDLSPAIKVEIDPPFMVQRDGTRVAIAYPDGDTQGIEIPSVQSVTVKGPIRSFTVFPLTQYSRIKNFSLTLEGKGSQPDLRSSVVNAELVGEIYVQ